MRTPTALVAAALTAAILLTASFLIAAGTHEETIEKQPAAGNSMGSPEIGDNLKRSPTRHVRVIKDG